MTSFSHTYIHTYTHGKKNPDGDLCVMNDGDLYVPSFRYFITVESAVFFVS